MRQCHVVYQSANGDINKRTLKNENTAIAFAILIDRNPLCTYQYTIIIKKGKTNYIKTI